MLTSHPVESGVEYTEVRLYEVTTSRDAADTIAAYAKAHPGLPWIKGTGWQLPIFPNGSPSRTLLDRVVPDRPAFLYSSDGHSAWVNSKALAIAGITRDTRDPPNGRIERDPRSGEPSGGLREAAINLVANRMPRAERRRIVGGIGQRPTAGQRLRDHGRVRGGRDPAIPGGLLAGR